MTLGSRLTENPVEVYKDQLEVVEEVPDEDFHNNLMGSSESAHEKECF